MYGRMLVEGRGVVCDLKAARAWFTRAADSDMADAQVALAEMMLNGRGGPVSTAGALDLFEKAAANGHAGAMFALGALHAGGHGMPTDRQFAQRWFRAAAELGHGHAQMMLGRYLSSGAAGDPATRRAGSGSNVPSRKAFPMRSPTLPPCARQREGRYLLRSNLSEHDSAAD